MGYDPLQWSFENMARAAQALPSVGSDLPVRDRTLMDSGRYMYTPATQPFVDNLGIQWSGGNKFGGGRFMVPSQKPVTPGKAFVPPMSNPATYGPAVNPVALAPVAQPQQAFTPQGSFVSNTFKGVSADGSLSFSNM